MNTTIPLTPDWKSAFQQSTMRTNFEMRLSQSMIEFLSATADDAHWDRVRDSTIHKPDNWVATSTSLQKRGLIMRKPQSQIDREGQEYRAKASNNGAYFWDSPCCYMLTPAGLAMVNLFKVVGIFVETEAAMNRRKKKG
jgi:hypothetical protein